MLVNLLCRLKGIVSRVSIQCPKGIPLAARIVPFADPNLDLRDSLIAGGSEIGSASVDADLELDYIFVIGTEHQVSGKQIFLWSNSWCGGISPIPFPAAEPENQSSIPVGPYLAACLAAGEVFKMARLKGYTPCGSTFYSLWNHAVKEMPITDGPAQVKTTLNLILAGVGAVGNAFLHTLWAFDGLDGKIVLTDNDEKGLDDTNLNRYVLFGAKSLGTQKATAAADLLRASPISWQAFNESFETTSDSTSFVVSAVDTNAARAAIQNRYASRIFSASTMDLRAEVMRCGPPGEGACLCCRNPISLPKSDAELRREADILSPSELNNLAEKIHISTDEASEWIKNGKCGTVGEALLPLLRIERDEAPFAVGFVSALAGTMLAAEVIKEHLNSNNSLSETKQRAVFQFQKPFARTNRAAEYKRDLTCAACDPNTAAVKIWKQRYNAFKV